MKRAQSTERTLPHILLVNPWIHDFAAYDFWAKPYGLLSLAGILRAHGVRVSYMDCLDRFHPRMPHADPHARQGRGPYLKTPLPNPPQLADIPRAYSRYGIRPEWFAADLKALTPKPDLILVTSLMTYWYRGVFETIRVLKAHFPEVPVVLGGIYARLYPEHARAFSGADQVVTDRGESLLDLVGMHTRRSITPHFDLCDLKHLPYPAFNLQRCINYIPLLTLRGCPFHCAYCASHYLEPSMRRRSPEHVAAEVEFWHARHGVVDFPFYDDALLVDARKHALPLLRRIIQKGLKVSFHTPNAVHIRAITAEVASVLFQSGFHTIRVGLETAAFEARRGLDRKVNEKEFLSAVHSLKAAGFGTERIGAYLLVGLPGQSVASVEQTIQMVKAAGITPVLTHYTPIVHTRLWPAAVAASRYDLAADPIYTNNAISTCGGEAFCWQTLSQLKALAHADTAF
jgi:hypothetical protein